MSMLSAQVDRLRELATRCDELQVGVVKAVTMPSDMGSILREAADTIWQLRDDLQRENAENAKLREQCADMDERHAKTFEVGKRWMAKAARFESENTKLRELVADAWGYISHPANATWTHEKRKEVRHSLSDRMRELGVEADG